MYTINGATTIYDPPVNSSELKKLSSSYEGIHYLRAVAALMVVICHAKLSTSGSDFWPTFGFAGVDIFFVISGFVMAHSTRNLDMTGNYIKRFYIAVNFVKKRLLRILPLYYLGLLWVARGELFRGQISHDFIKDFLFIPHPSPDGLGMLAPALTQGWTLNYEMFFYALFALSMLFGRYRFLLLFLWLISLVLLGGFSIGFTNHFDFVVDAASIKNIATAFYTNNILLEFGFGIVAYQLMGVWSNLNWSRYTHILIVIFSFIVLAYFADNYQLRSLRMGIPATIIVLSSAQAFIGKKNSILQLLGDASYAIYIFHWASFGMIKPLANFMGASVRHPFNVSILMLTCIAAATLAGVVIHLVIEKPLMHYLKRFA